MRPPLPATILSLLLCVTPAAGQAIPGTSTDEATARPAHVSLPSAGGEDFSTATPIPELPYGDSGNTCSFQDDINWWCWFATDTGPDVVYSFEPRSDMTVTFSLCNSTFYDSILFLFEDWEAGQAGTVIEVRATLHWRMP